ncbi:cobalamin B12-binding domain-containing protein [Lentisalinibacter salinarum]|uniref:cobalamin B12-binding domain-containing protein n=1 Tax=Lentisalinibacter salinarum TaxID=2992239 RepID=UPI0038652A86
MPGRGARHLAGDDQGPKHHPLAKSGETDEDRWREDDDDCEVPRDRLAQLVRIIESETIPRLVLAHKKEVDLDDQQEHAGPGVDPEAVRELAALVLSPNQELALTYVRSMRDKGIRRERLFLDLLGPTARYLGSLWEDDLCDFTEVTVGLCRLHQLVREMSPGFMRAGNGVEIKRALLAPVPGEQHTFGLLMVTEFFRREGWDVWGGPSASHSDVLQVVNSEKFSVVGFSVSCDDRLDELTEWIQTIRNQSRNPEIGVLVGGRVFIDNPELVREVGADATALDGRQAPLEALGLPRQLKRH